MKDFAFDLFMIEQTHQLPMYTYLISINSITTRKKKKIFHFFTYFQFFSSLCPHKKICIFRICACSSPKLRNFCKNNINLFYIFTTKISSTVLKGVIHFKYSILYYLRRITNNFFSFLRIPSKFF